MDAMLLQPDIEFEIHGIWHGRVYNRMIFWFRQVSTAPMLTEASSTDGCSLHLACTACTPYGSRRPHPPFRYAPWPQRTQLRKKQYLGVDLLPAPSSSLPEPHVLGLSIIACGLDSLFLCSSSFRGLLVFATGISFERALTAERRAAGLDLNNLAACPWPRRAPASRLYPGWHW